MVALALITLSPCLQCDRASGALWLAGYDVCIPNHVSSSSILHYAYNHYDTLYGAIIDNAKKMINPDPTFRFVGPTVTMVYIHNVYIYRAQLHGVDSTLLHCLPRTTTGGWRLAAQRDQAGPPRERALLLPAA